MLERITVIFFLWIMKECVEMMELLMVLNPNTLQDQCHLQRQSSVYIISNFIYKFFVLVQLVIKSSWMTCQLMSVFFLFFFFTEMEMVFNLRKQGKCATLYCPAWIGLSSAPQLDQLQGCLIITPGSIAFAAHGLHPFTAATWRQHVLH